MLAWPPIGECDTCDLAMPQIALTDERIERLLSLIGDSFRVRPNQDPVYVDVGGHLARVAAKQHQVIFGRRGSGKSCLLVHFHRQAPGRRVLSLYIDADEIKRLSYPDVLIRLLLTLTDRLPSPKRRLRDRVRRRPPAPIERQRRELRGLLDLASDTDVEEEAGKAADRGIGGGVSGGPVNLYGSRASNVTYRRVSKYSARKLDTLERRLQDYKRVLTDALAASEYDHATVILDDFYLISRSAQPDVVDYMHRLLRGTDFYLKIGTIRHRTSLIRYDDQTIGVELGHDLEEISLDRTFEDVDATEEYLTSMLASLGQQVGIEHPGDFISDDGLLHLTLASGGVPRDYLNTLVEAVPVARSLHQQRVTPRAVHRGASRLSYRTKLKSLTDDAAGDASSIERVLGDLVTFCLKEQRKTAFLISQGEVPTHQAEHEVVQQLMDLRLIHVIESDTSAASGRGGRYEAYTLDFPFFMEPRLRGISHVEFWKTDDQRRRRGVREAPTYELDRVGRAVASSEPAEVERVIDAIQADLGSEEDGEPEARPDQKQ